jgi:hypothetical protein
VRLENERISAVYSNKKIYLVLVFGKPGGLDSREQSRFLDLSRSTFEKCRDYPFVQNEGFCEAKGKLVRKFGSG